MHDSTSLSWQLVLKQFRLVQLELGSLEALHASSRLGSYFLRPYEVSFNGPVWHDAFQLEAFF